MNDPLAKFRKELPKSGVVKPVGEGEYLAFEGIDKASRLTIKRANDPACCPFYLDITDIRYDDEFWTNFVLVMSYKMFFTVEGKNLRPIVEGLKMGMVNYIQEFNPDKWKQPTDPDAPFIERIGCIVGKSGPAVPEGGGGGTVH